jgi:ergothioneine biosynthesis protein EgtB
MRRLLGEGARPPPPAIAFAVELGVNHSEQHQELIATDVKVVLARNPLRPAYAPPPPPAPARPGELGWVSHGGGLVELGHAGDAFAFDNERPRHRVYLEPFQLANRLVTCQEYVEFIQDGGYQAPTLWLSDGWAACRQHGWEAPMYWERTGDGSFQVATLQGLRPVDPLEPVVHVSLYEADAFARWKRVRLPLEAEWEVAVAASAPEPAPAGTAVHPEPLRRPPEPNQMAQAFGTAWQWTQSPYVPYPGFRPFEGGFGEYNGKFMSNQLVLRGSSCATPPRHARLTYRNFFRPDARWQISGIRLAR